MKKVGYGSNFANSVRRRNSGSVASNEAQDSTQEAKKVLNRLEILKGSMAPGQGSGPRLTINLDPEMPILLPHDHPDNPTGRRSPRLPGRDYGRRPFHPNGSGPNLDPIPWNPGAGRPPGRPGPGRIPFHPPGGGPITTLPFPPRFPHDGSPINPGVPKFSRPINKQMRAELANDVGDLAKKAFKNLDFNDGRPGIRPQPFPPIHLQEDGMIPDARARIRHPVGGTGNLTLAPGGPNGNSPRPGVGKDPKMKAFFATRGIKDPSQRRAAMDLLIAIGEMNDSPRSLSYEKIQDTMQFANDLMTKIGPQRSHNSFFAALGNSLFDLQDKVSSGHAIGKQYDLSIFVEDPAYSPSR